MLRNRRGRLPGVTVDQFQHYPRQSDGFQGWIGYTTPIDPEFDEPPTHLELQAWAKRQNTLDAAIPELSDASGYGREPKPLTNADREAIQAENVARREEAKRERQREAEVRRAEEHRTRRERRVDDAITASIKAAQARMEATTNTPIAHETEREYAPRLDRFVIKKTVDPYTKLTVDGRNYTVTDWEAVLAEDGTLYVTELGWRGILQGGRRRHG